jgi:hypothetical protein
MLVIDYEDSPLCFQDRSLRQYFKSVSVEDDGTTEFRTPAAAAHLTILQMCVDIMMTAAQEPRSSTRSGLTLYAITYWYEHLKELDVDTVSSAVVRDVLVILHCITNNKNNVAKLFEELATDTEIYPEPTPDGPTAWFDTLTPWAKKATTLPNGSINDEILDWAVTVNRDNVLLPLAQGHVQNWLDADDEFWIPEIFRFVKSALACVSLSSGVKTNLRIYRRIVSRLMKMIHFNISTLSSRNIMFHLRTTRLCESLVSRWLTTSTRQTILIVNKNWPRKL